MTGKKPILRTMVHHPLCTRFVTPLLPIALALCACAFFASCGISGGSGSAAPTNIISPSSDDPVNNLFRFTTTDTENFAAHGGNYHGTAIFYKIYTNTSTLISEASSITVSGGQAKNKATALSYRLLNGEASVIPPSSVSKQVTIRLTNETSYTAGITYSGSTKVPTRENATSFGFTPSYYPKTTDSDFAGDETPSGPWYVAAFAAATVYEEGSLQDTYSEFKYLGYVKISE